MKNIFLKFRPVYTNTHAAMAVEEAMVKCFRFLTKILNTK